MLSIIGPHKGKVVAGGMFEKIRYNRYKKYILFHVDRFSFEGPIFSSRHTSVLGSTTYRIL